jgi:hypothetical protein
VLGEKIGVCRSEAQLTAGYSALPRDSIATVIHPIHIGAGSGARAQLATDIRGLLLAADLVFDDVVTALATVRKSALASIRLSDKNDHGNFRKSRRSDRPIALQGQVLDEIANRIRHMKARPE